MPGTSRRTVRTATTSRTVHTFTGRAAVTVLALAAALTATGTIQSYADGHTRPSRAAVTATAADSTTPDTSCAYCWGA